MSEATATPAFAPQSWPLAAAYMSASVFLALTQGLAQGFVTANLPQIAGEIGTTTTQAAWLMAAYMIPRASLTLLLMKIRTQYGLRRFAEIGIVFYVITAVMALRIDDLHSAIAVQFVMGVAAAPLSSIAILYMLEPLPPTLKLKYGIPVVLTIIMMGAPLARVITPELWALSSWNGLHLMGLGMAVISMVLVYALPLSPQPRARVISALDLFSFALIAVALGGFSTVFIMGYLHWWTTTPWLGWLLAVALAAGALAVATELNREAPLLDIRWILSPAIVHLTMVLFLFRIILTEQSTGAPGLFRQLGYAPEQLQMLFVVIVLAGLAGGLAAIRFMSPDKVGHAHLVALVLIACGAWMDSHSTLLTGPEQMYLSQAMVAFAGGLFLPPAMAMGMMSALAKGPSYILSFIIVFLTTQLVGGMIGSGLFNTFILWREKFHMSVLADRLTATNPEIARHLAALAQSHAATTPDSGLRQAEAAATLAKQAAAQAYVMAYNDAYALMALVAIFAAGLLALHMINGFFKSGRATAATAK
ncbi:MFS transporter [Qingshengfaniella alkalisoli]|uniref:MFS transporter n=1 Tax=Qingshengfaniella alkalisoli TaxID=2599296 RepID=A0A5B8I8F2_9RHOB|nr:MFS transporter [Qingshengfaniella alkalisoli]QDY70039.1 MFS transporter [Qingshengfaniella alkalisoli]